MKLTQTTWETWFVASIIWILALIFVGTLDGSREITIYPYVLTLSVINIIICAYVGQQPSTDDDEV
jgi:hypothetical protein